MSLTLRAVRGSWPRAVALLAAGWAGSACGGSSGSDNSCDPPCGIDQVCVDGMCERADAGDAADVVEDLVDTAEGSDLIPDEAADEAAGEDVVEAEAEAADEGHADVDAAGFNIGGACLGDGECVGPGTGSCLTTLTLPVVGAVGFPNGYCTSTCDGADPTSCGDGSWCVNLLGWIHCLQACTPGTPGECREAEGYSCFDPSTMPYITLPGPVCVPPLTGG